MVHVDRGVQVSGAWRWASERRGRTRDGRVPVQGWVGGMVHAVCLPCARVCVQRAWTLGVCG